MEFLYVFALMFLSIFGLAMLIRLFFGAEDGLDEFVRFAGKCSHIGKINIILSGGEPDNAARSLAKKFAEVNIIGGQGR